jgi:diguanylate cyclase (GGDEF)-like protein
LPVAALIPRFEPGVDPLTGLPDRAAFLHRLSMAGSERRTVAVLFLDLDDFKVVNDGFGHESGDRLLVEVAGRLTESVREGDMVARLGGDEFTVLLEGVTDAERALAVAGHIRQAMAAPFRIGGQRRHVRVSIGCKVADEQFDAETLLRDADSAMYQAKGAGKDRVEVFSEETRRRIVRKLELEQRLRAALDEQTLEVHYQPQIDLTSGRMVGVEALARWDQAVPNEFIPLAEETGLIGPLGAWVLRTALRDLAGWHAAGLKPLSVTVNISTRQLDDPELPALVAHALAVADIDPTNVCLELTEGALMGVREHALERLRAIKGLGVYVAIDDFGTGHSSLSRLRRLPVEVLKVDRSFVDGLGTDREDSAVVAAILSLAHAMGLHVIAEGVETPLQANQLTALGCPVAQGFLWSPAVPAVAIAGIAQDGTVRPPRMARYRGERSLVDEMLRQIGFAKEAE